MESSSKMTDPEKKTSRFLGFMKKRNKKTKQRSIPVEPVQQHRRIVKAIHPPNTPPDMALLERHKSLDEDTQDERDDESENHLPATKLPLIQHQLEIDHAEKWRQQRLEISAAFRKEGKEREIKDHRFKSAEGGSHKSPKPSDSNGGNTNMMIQSLQAISSILSVESQFPEHKRTVQERGSEEPTSVKRTKVLDEPSLILVKTEKKKEKWIANDQILSLGVAATAVAIVAIGLMKFFRR